MEIEKIRRELSDVIQAKCAMFAEYNKSTVCGECKRSYQRGGHRAYNTDEYRSLAAKSSLLANQLNRLLYKQRMQPGA